MRDIPHLWHVIITKVCENRNLKLSECRYDNRIVNRAAHILTLEVVLDEHRNEFGTLFEPLDGLAALHHLIFTKTHWPLADIRTLSLADSLLVIQSDIRIDRLPIDAQTFLQSLNFPVTPSTFNELLERDWVPMKNLTFPPPLS